MQLSIPRPEFQPLSLCSHLVINSLLIGNLLLVNGSRKSTTFKRILHYAPLLSVLYILYLDLSQYSVLDALDILLWYVIHFHMLYMCVFYEHRDNAVELWEQHQCGDVAEAFQDEDDEEGGNDEEEDEVNGIEWEDDVREEFGDKLMALLWSLEGRFDRVLEQVSAHCSP